MIGQTILPYRIKSRLGETACHASNVYADKFERLDRKKRR